MTSLHQHNLFNNQAEKLEVKTKTDLSGTVFRSEIDGIVFKLEAKYYTHFLQIADLAKNVLLLLLDGSPLHCVYIRHETSRVVLPLLLVT